MEHFDLAYYMQCGARLEIRTLTLCGECHTPLYSETTTCPICGSSMIKQVDVYWMLPLTGPRYDTDTHHVN